MIGIFALLLFLSFLAIIYIGIDFLSVKLTDGRKGRFKSHNTILISLTILLFISFTGGCSLAEADLETEREVAHSETEIEETNHHNEGEEDKSNDEDEDLLAENEEQVDLSDEAKEAESEEVEVEAEDKDLAPLTVHFIDVGQADASLIEFGDRAILIDSGNWNGNQTVNYLHSQGIDHLDLIVGTHEHADHIGQIDKVIDAFPVDEVWLNGGIANSQVFERLVTAIDQHGLNYDEPRAGDHYEIDDLQIDVLSPSHLSGRPNDDSIVLKLVYGGISFLFTGDAERQAENQMVQSSYSLDATILKVGHHGSDTSSTEAFVSEVSPETAIISVGENSQYSHPNQSVLDRFAKHDVDLYATSAHGHVKIKTDGDTYDVETTKESKIIAGDKVKEKPKKQKKKKTQTTKSKQEESTQTNRACVDINEASEIELQKIKHIGEIRALDVISNRPYDSLDQLERVSGIAAKRLADIKEEGIACVN